MKRHGDFNKLPKPEELTTLSAAKARFPAAFKEKNAPIHLAGSSPVELETSSGAMTAYDMLPGGANWVYFPGEGWDGY